MAQLDHESRGNPATSAAAPGREVLSAIGGAAEEKLKSVVSVSREKIDRLKKKTLEDIYNDTKTLVRENPGKSLLGGLLAGFALGMLFRRR